MLLVMRKAVRPATTAETLMMTRPILRARMFLYCLDFLAARMTAAPALSVSGSGSNPVRSSLLPPEDKSNKCCVHYCVKILL